MIFYIASNILRNLPLDSMGRLKGEAYQKVVVWSRNGLYTCLPTTCYKYYPYQFYKQDNDFQPCKWGFGLLLWTSLDDGSHSSMF